MMKRLFRCTLILAVFILGVWSAGCSAAKPIEEKTDQAQATTPAAVSESEPDSEEAPSSQPAEAQAVEPEFKLLWDNGG